MSVLDMLDMIPPGQCVRIFNPGLMAVIYEGTTPVQAKVSGTVVAVYTDGDVLVIGVL